MTTLCQQDVGLRKLFFLKFTSTLRDSRNHNPNSPTTTACHGIGPPIHEAT